MDGIKAKGNVRQERLQREEQQRLERSRPQQVEVATEPKPKPKAPHMSKPVSDG